MREWLMAPAWQRVLPGGPSGAGRLMLACRFKSAMSVLNSAWRGRASTFGVPMRIGSCFRPLLLAVLCGLAGAAAAQALPAALPTGSAATTEQFLKGVLEKRLRVPRVDGIMHLPRLNLYEARIGTDVIYIDPKGEHIFVGNIINTATGENLTKARTDQLAEAATPKVSFGELPFAQAFKIVKGNGKRQIAVFADPNCVYCKRFEQTLAQMPDLTVWVFLYPILGPDSVEKTQAIWCSADRAKAWRDWMLNGTVPESAKAPCAAPLDKMVGLGRSLKVDGTPTMVFANGRRVSGAMRAEDLQKMLAAAS